MKTSCLCFEIFCFSIFNRDFRRIHTCFNFSIINFSRRTFVHVIKNKNRHQLIKFCWGGWEVLDNESFINNEIYAKLR